MLNPNDDRLFYGNILSPPENYELDFAIGTTYSLNLNALISISISLGLNDDVDSDLTDDPIYLLDALHKTSDNMVIFCESGQIHLPNKVTPLFILLENVVFQVSAAKMFKNNRYASFHPKFWLIKYCDNGGNILYRLIVLSRNLTFDRSWDISFSMDGQKREELTEKNDAIIDFIRYLMKYTTDDKKIYEMKKIAEELKHIHFNLESEIFNDYDFIINGIGGNYSIQNSSLYIENLNELLIVSPFLSKDIINTLNNHKNTNSKALLFTRLSSLSRLKANDCNNFEIYTLKDEIIDGESVFSEDSQETSKQDIHAKIYFIENKNSSQLYLGSLNASHNAFFGNVEFMIKLLSKKHKLNINQITNDLFNGEKGGPNDPFKLFNVEDIMPEDEDEEKSLDFVLKYISHLNSKANIISNGNCYNIELKFDNVDYTKIKDCNVLIKPLLSKEECEFSNYVLFEDISKLHLSEFFIITIKGEKDKEISRVIKINTEGMPLDRHKEVISHIITDKVAFIKYIAFLLGDDFILSAIENENLGKSSKSINMDLPELYEKMLKAACYNPQKFEEIDFLINALGDDDVIPEGFKELYNTFIKVIDKYE